MKKNIKHKTGYYYYVEKRKTAKECAKIVEVTEKTFGNWVAKFGWKHEREALAIAANEDVLNIKKIISDCAQERIDAKKKIEEKESELVKETAKKIDGETDDEKEERLDILKEQITSLRERIHKLADQVSKWNKALLDIKNQNSIKLETYISIMREIFQAMNVSNPKEYMSLLDFQREFINKKAIELG